MMSRTTTERRWLLAASVLIAGCASGSGDPTSEHEPMRSRLHACVVSTAVAVPSRFSLSQLKNTNNTRVVLSRIGSTFAGARTRAIGNGRGLAGNAQHVESITSRCGTDSSPATYQPLFDGPLPILDATSPQG
jgi:hypothetical protein